MKYIRQSAPLLLVFLLFFSAVSCAGGKSAADTVTSVSKEISSITISGTENETEAVTEKHEEYTEKEKSEPEKESATESETSKAETDSVHLTQKASTAKHTVTATKKETAKAVVSEPSRPLRKEDVTTRKYIRETVNVTENSVSQADAGSSSSVISEHEKARVTVNCKHAAEYGISEVPQNGIMLDTQVPCRKGDTAMDVLKRALSSNNISIDESRGYVREIGGLREKDCGGSSGWMYTVNSESPMMSSDKYAVGPGDTITFYYVTNYGDTV